jgi:hypothetical protein
LKARLKLELQSLKTIAPVLKAARASLGKQRPCDRFWLLMILSEEFCDLRGRFSDVELAFTGRRTQMKEVKPLNKVVSQHGSTQT